MRPHIKESGSFFDVQVCVGDYEHLTVYSRQNVGGDAVTIVLRWLFITWYTSVYSIVPVKNSNFFADAPAHIAFVLPYEEGRETPLFASVTEKVGGDKTVMKCTEENSHSNTWHAESSIKTAILDHLGGRFNNSDLTVWFNDHMVQTR
ncbi:hypothetical protein EDD18DRAFT_1110346 [Armillaria luteobubalina]|uniref:Uncharacterized protein n=1 Tax=Armillaria luteobubalina TaxID=153913 RepID=A0AA39PQW2_9AGAR|nr:hypothetical protein EDD18DRAFT_1110346 [Armillaria luteobubalina]